MAVIGTGVSDGNFYQRQAARTGEALSMVLARLEEKRERKKQEELRDIDRFFKVAESYPEVASTWGERIKTKYGEKHPGVSEMVDVLKNRYAMAGAVKDRQEQAKNAWLNNWDSLNAGYAQQTEAVQALPEQAPMPGAALPGAGFGSPAAGMVPMFGENEFKNEAEQALRQTDPRYFSRKALEQLPPQLQVAAADYLKTQTAFEPPAPQTIFDPYKNLPTEQQALYAGQQGLIPAEGYQAARVKLGMAVSPSRKAFEKFQVEDREDRQTYDTEDREDDQSWRDADREKRDQQMKARIAYQDSLSRAREARRVANEHGLIDHRSKVKVDGEAGVAWDALVKDSKQAQKDWDARLKQATQGLESSQRSKARINFLKQNGERPRALSETQARRMARELNSQVKEGSLSLEEAEDQALDMTSDIMAGDSFPAARAANRQRTMGKKNTEEREDHRVAIQTMHPEWTPDQVEAAVNDYLWTLAEGDQ